MIYALFCGFILIQVSSFFIVDLILHAAYLDRS